MAGLNEDKDKQASGDQPLNQATQTLGQEEVRTIQALWKSILVVFGLLVLGSFALVNWFSALSVTIGAVLALANFAYMSRTLKRYLLKDGGKKSMGRVLVRYYIRFAITAAVLTILIWQGWAQPLGLLVGLGTVVISLTLWGIFQARHL